MFSRKVVINGVHCVCCRMWWLVVISAGLVRPHSQHTCYVMSAHYQLPEMPTVRSTCPTDIPRWISIHMKMWPQSLYLSLSGSQSTCRHIRSMSWTFIVLFYELRSMYKLKVVFCELQCMCNVKLVMCTSCKTCAAHWPAQQCLLCSPICHRDVYPCHDMDVQ